jgi:hypothetical protein
VEWCELARVERGSLLQNSLLPESMGQCGIQIFYQYKGLVEPYSREEAKGHLIAIIEGVYNALKELHNPSPPQTCTP